MKALIFNEPEEPVVTRIQTPLIADSEVFIRSRRIGICHSDFELLAGRQNQSSDAMPRTAASVGHRSL